MQIAMQSFWGFEMGPYVFCKKNNVFFHHPCIIVGNYLGMTASQATKYSRQFHDKPPNLKKSPP
jgi:hypothetical protein